MPRSLAANVFIIRAAWVEPIYRRDYVDGRMYRIGIGWRVRAECCDHYDCFLYSGCSESTEAYVFENYSAAVKFAEDAVGAHRVANSGYWVECD